VILITVRLLFKETAQWDRSGLGSIKDRLCSGSKWGFLGLRLARNTVRSYGSKGNSGTKERLLSDEETPVMKRSKKRKEEVFGSTRYRFSSSLLLLQSLQRGECVPVRFEISVSLLQVLDACLMEVPLFR
jgi:hypothetical protein